MKFLKITFWIVLELKQTTTKSFFLYFYSPQCEKAINYDIVQYGCREWYWRLIVCFILAGSLKNLVYYQNEFMGLLKKNNSITAQGRSDYNLYWN